MSIRIESCTIDAFGPLMDVDLSALDEPVVVLQGRNEAGKTAFFHFLQTMFYGIYPTDAGNHPYAPREGRPLEGAMDFRVSDGTSYTVRRRLRSTPQGQLHEADGLTTRLRNRTVPAARHVPRSVYASVYALQLDDLVRLDGEAWDEVQDRLLGTLSVDHIRPARVVVDELDDEATDLWRTDNRGKPEAKRLETRRRELQDAASDARERDKKIRRMKDEISELSERIDALKEEEVELKGKQRRAERLAPVRSLLQQIDELEERAGDVSEYEDIPEDPDAALEDLQESTADLEDRLEEKRSRLQRLERAREGVTQEDECLLGHADAIRGWTRRIERHEQQRMDVEDLRREKTQAEQRLEDAAAFLTTSWDEAYADPVRTLSLADLRERIKMYQRAEQRLRETRARAETVGLHAQARKALLPWMVMVGVGFLAMGIGLFVSLPIGGIPVVGGALVLVGILQAVAAWRHNRQIDVQKETLDFEEKERDVEKRATNVERLVEPFPLPKERLEHPSPDLVTDFQSLKEMLRERDEKAGAVEEKEIEVQENEEDIRGLAQRCGLEDAEIEQPIEEIVATLERRLEAAEDRRDAADEAEDEVPELQSEVASLEDRVRKLQERRTNLVNRLEALADGSVDEGIEELKQRRKAARRAELSRDRLHSEYPDWEERRAEIQALESDEEGWHFTDEERARIDQRLGEIEERRREAEKSRAAKEKDVEHLSEQRTVDEVESERAHVERRLRDVRTERDRRKLLAGVLRTAEAEFRRKHQPDVIRRASEYLAAITQGRYQRLALDRDEDHLVVFDATDALPQSVEPPLSRGTLDQIYLALRLAIIDHLDADGERLPVFLDEVFVNWDKYRRHAAFEILSEMARERQLFFFTCHPYFAQEAVDHLPATRIDLSDPQGGGDSADSQNWTISKEKDAGS